MATATDPRTGHAPRSALTLDESDRLAACRQRSSDIFSADLFGREPDASSPRRLPGSTAYNPLGAKVTKHGDPL